MGVSFFGGSLFVAGLKGDQRDANHFGGPLMSNYDVKERKLDLLDNDLDARFVDFTCSSLG